MANKKAIKERKLGWYLKAPIRFLSRARNLYVNGMNRLSPHLNSVDAAFGCPASNPVVLPRSFSAGAAASSSSSVDYKELVRANSVPHRSHGGELDLSVTQKQPPAKVSKTAVPRSRSVGIGRINEDEACEFDDDFETKPFVHARSRSYAVRSTRAVNYSK